MGRKLEFETLEQEVEHYRSQKQKMLDRGQRDRIKIKLLMAKCKLHNIEVTKEEVDLYIEKMNDITHLEDDILE